MKIKILAMTKDAEKLCEIAGRTCYASFDKITETSCENFIKNIIKSGHLSVLEHASVTFKIESISRACLSQLTRHRHASFSVESQRYVCQDDVSIHYITDPIYKNKKARNIYNDFCESSLETYKKLLKLGIKKEDARMVLLNGITTNLVMTCNFRELLHIIDLRVSRGAQDEIRNLFIMIWEKMYKKYPNIFGLTYFEFHSKDHGFKVTASCDFID